MIELELTFLAKKLPENLESCESKKIIDLYIENGTNHADLRIRKNGDKYQITRKRPVENSDSSIQEENDIQINEIEFNNLKSSKAKKIEKNRFYYKLNNNIAEIDVFEGDLKGLVLIDFEFKTDEEKNNFEKPDFCLVDVTQEEFTAGGMLAGKKYSDIEEKLNKFNYTTI